MSWEVISDNKEKAVCACGKGFAVRNVCKRADDWNRFDERIYGEGIECPECAKKYHIEHVVKHYNCMRWDGDGIVDTTYLVPNNMTLKIQTEPERLPYENTIRFNDRAVALYSKDELIAARNDMEVSKFSTRLTLAASRDLVSMYNREKKSKKLANVMDAIDYCVENYDSFEWTYPKIKAFREKEAGILEENKDRLAQALAVSLRLEFDYKGD